MKKTLLKKKLILIIGGTGFIGYNLANFFIKKNYNILSISRSRAPKGRKLKKVKYLHVDISKNQLLKKKIKKYLNIDYVINLGGEVEHNNFAKVYQSHFIGLKNISNIFLKKKIKRFIQIGSSMEYGKKKSPQTEKSLCKPISHYGKIKYKASNYLIYLYRKYKFPVTIIRPYQIYGPAQFQNRIIPFVIYNCLKSKKFACSSGTQYRDFLYVSDFVDAINRCLITKKEINGEIINIGFGKPLNVKKIINFIKIKIKKGIPEFGKIKFRKEENLITYPSISKSNKLIGWKPKVKFKMGILKTINYYKGKI